jgi:hypothetical protein
MFIWAFSQKASEIITLNEKLGSNNVFKQLERQDTNLLRASNARL